MTIAQKSLAILATAAVSVAIVASFFGTIATAEAATLTGSQIQAIVSLLQSFGADPVTIANVSASLNGTAPSGPAMSGPCTFTTDLTIGSKGDAVTCLQHALIAAGHAIPAGATGYFGSQTQAAVAAWQKAAGVSPAAGYFGAKSRAAWGGTSSTPGPTPVPAGTGLTVSACPAQPVNSLAPQGATRVPFTCFTLTAGNDGDVTVNSVTIQRTGLGNDAAFSGVILIDESNAMQIGVSKTFNSNHQTQVGAPVTIPRGTSKSFLVAGNMAAALLSYVGQAPSISVIAVNTSASVTGSLPITGAYQTLNSTLTVGSLTLNTSNAYATNSNSTQNIGTTAYRFSGFRLTAGSAEDITLKSVTWNQTGSVSATDLANVVTVVNGTSYPTTISADGKYYYTNLGAGVVIGKGNAIDVYSQGDIIGSNAGGRTVIFDVDKNTDIFATGNTYGYGISPAVGAAAPSGTRSVLEVTNGTPYIYAAQISVTGASITTISKANEVPAQNIAINVPNQPLGGFAVDLKGESMTVQKMIFDVATTSGAQALTNVTLVDSNGSVVAGPVDSSYGSSGASTLTFTDTVTFATGRHIYTLRGKAASDSTNGGTYVVSTTPSSEWTNVKGVTSGNTISLTGLGAFSMNTMTVKAGSLGIGVSSNPATQTIVAGGSQVLFANFQFDASNSGEDVRFSTIPTTLTFGGTSVKTDLSSCQFYDGATALNTGSSVLNPSNATATTSAYNVTIALDNAVTVTKGTVKTVGIRCNVSGSSTSGGTYSFKPQTYTTFTLTGATSGTTITGSDTSSPTITVTVNTGALTVSAAADAPSYLLASAGSTGVASNALKFHASNEDIAIQKLGLTLTNTASSSSSDLVKATIWDGSTKVGEAYFTGSNTSATSTLTQLVTIPKNTDHTLYAQVDLAYIGTGQPVTFSGHLVAVNYLNAEGVGVQSGTTYKIGTAAGSTSAAGVRVFESFPTVAKDTLGSTGIADGELMRFKVTADSKGPIGIAEFNLTFATTSVTLSNVKIYGYTDSSYSTPVSGVGSAGALSDTGQPLGTAWASASTVFRFTVNNNTASTTVQVPASGTRYFSVKGSVSGVGTASSITTTLKGGSAFITDAPAAVGTNPLVQAGDANLVGSGVNDFVWSPNSTTTAARGDNDWTGGYGISGLPSTGLINTRGN